MIYFAKTFLLYDLLSSKKILNLKDKLETFEKIQIGIGICYYERKYKIKCYYHILFTLYLAALVIDAVEVLLRYSLKTEVLRIILFGVTPILNIFFGVILSIEKGCEVFTV